MAFRDFMLHTATGDPSKLQIMYAIAGERRLTEFELPELPGYEGSRPVRVGNAASEQFQLDVYGEVLNVAYLGVQLRGRMEPRLWPRWRNAIEYVETIWREPDDGIWESRGPRRHYTYSKVMAWVVFDRAVRLAEQFDLDAPVDRWRLTRDEIHQEICDRGYDRERRTFTQYYGSRELDASVLNIPLVGFLPGSGRTGHGHHRRHSARAGPRRLRLPILHRRHRRRPHRGRGAVPGLLVLAGECVGGQRPDLGSPRPVRAAPRPGQRPRAAGRGVRRRAPATGGELSSGLQPPHARPGGARDHDRRGSRGGRERREVPGGERYAHTGI